MSNNSSYTAKNISVLEGLEAVRKRPGMYVGDTTHAVLQMVFEVIDNCIDEHSMNYCDSIFFEFKDGIFAIRDNGRGIPVDLHESGLPAVEVILTTLHSGGKFNSDSYQYSGGLHGVGVSVVNALAKFLEVEVYRDNTIYFMRFENGNTAIQLEERGYTELQGTKITFKPDLELIDSLMPTSEEIEKRLQELSYLNNKLTIHYEFNEIQKTFFSQGGILDLTKKLGKPILPSTLHFISDRVDAAFFWDETDEEKIMSFTNNIFQIDGGTHLFGMRAIISKIVLPYVEEEILKGKTKVKKVLPEDVRSGLKGVISIKIIEPKFSSQTKNKLVSAEAKPLVEDFLQPLLSEFLEKNTKERELIIKKVLSSAELRELITRSKESVKKANIDAFSVLPGKLVDCQYEEPERCELYIVEGDSAGGSAKMARDRKYQAILALGGKPLNVERAHLNKALNCEGIITLIAALGTGVSQNFDIEKLRYHKIILMTDADVDGSHIRCLLITFFLKLLPEVVERGHLYIARTPLYKISHGKSNKYLQDEEELKSYLFNRFFENHKIQSGGQILNIEEIEKLVLDCTDFSNFVKQKSLTVDSKILSFALIYDIFKTPELFKNNIQNVVDGDCVITETETGVMLNINSLYGKNTYNIRDYGTNWKMDLFPLIIDSEKIYEPLEFLKIFQKKSTAGMTVQRYKGLGEMNPDELRETSLQPEKSILEQLVIDGSIEDTIMHMKTVMGNENNRREFVLGHIREVFGIYI